MISFPYLTIFGKEREVWRRHLVRSLGQDSVRLRSSIHAERHRHVAPINGGKVPHLVAKDRLAVLEAAYAVAPPISVASPRRASS